MAKTKGSLNLLKNKAKKEIDSAKDLKDLDLIYKTYLGDESELAQILRSLKDLSKKKKAKIGKEANELKNFLKIKFTEAAAALKEKAEKEKEMKEWFDITVPGKKAVSGHLHPITLVRRKTEEVFQSMGFSVIEGPEMEEEWYNFDALNIPKNHPARDLWDTFYLKNGLLLRTHTSPVQIRYMEKNQPPLRIIVPGRCFRHEATDFSHEINFYHVEGLMVGEGISVANFKAIIEEFFRKFFGKPMEIRFRPSYFPFVEPGFEIDMKWNNEWLEMMGAGMVHPNVFKNAGLPPHQINGGGWQGFAFGIGLERLAMIKYKVEDIRLFYGGDLKFLNQF
ncbi:MAG: phenylalanine--tRNA ligase subunit alpha [Candidatus Nealsonbacteria bacterium]|nr:phenylalanine--tRNA ligase subunit alpha [Candidatus Nealsonbacteria bacterium]